MVRQWCGEPVAHAKQFYTCSIISGEMRNGSSAYFKAAVLASFGVIMDVG